MEISINSSANTTRECDSNETSTCSRLLPVGIVAFAPFILAELVVASVSNALLIILVVKACLGRVQNNTTVYLFSLGALGMIEAVNLFTLLVTITARRWVFGSALCEVNNAIAKLHIFTPYFFHLAISRDRYTAVRDPFHWQPKSRMPYIWTAIIWAFAVICSAIISIRNVRHSNSNSERFFSCFFIDTGCRRTNVITFLFVSGLYFIVIAATLVYTLTHYILILKDLNLTERLRVRNRRVSSSEITVNKGDKPVECTSEERAARSLAVIFFVQLVCSALSGVLAIIRFSEALAQGGSVEENAHAAERILWLFVYFFPSTNPAILILINKRFRRHIRDLFRCDSELRTNVELEQSPRQASHSLTQLTRIEGTSLSKKANPVHLFIQQADKKAEDVRQEARVAGRNCLSHGQRSCEIWPRAVETESGIQGENDDRIVAKEAWTKDFSEY